MVGISYGGGIQLVTAAIDDRVDAIVPTIAWNNLNTRSRKNGAPKTQLGLEAGRRFVVHGAKTDSRILPALIKARLTGTIAQADKEFLDARGPDFLLDDITAPTLLIEGTVDTLFTLQRPMPTRRAYRERCSDKSGVVLRRPRRLYHEYQRRRSDRPGDTFVARQVRKGHAGGHWPAVRMGRSAWAELLVRHLSREAGNRAGSVDRRRRRVAAQSVLRRFGPEHRAFEGGLIHGFLGLLSGAEAKNAVELTTPEATTTTYIVGAPEVEFTYSGTGSSRHVYAQLVDDGTGLVLGNHVTPIPVTLDGEEHTIKIPLEMVAHTLAPGGDGDAAIGRLGGDVSNAWRIGRIERVEHEAQAADSGRRGDHDSEPGHDHDCGLGTWRSWGGRWDRATFLANVM